MIGQGAGALGWTGWVMVGLPVVLGAGVYGVYPVVLEILSRAVSGYRLPEGEPEEWPSITILVPAYNEEAVIRDKLENVLSLEYPEERRQVLVVSDASTDRTDEIVLEYEDRGVELVRLEGRGGKTAAENAAREHARGEIVVTSDATIRILPGALKNLVRVFQDPTVGVASGRDVSVPPGGEEAVNPGESGYVGYEMWVRSLETRLGGIVGASGCFFGIRADLFGTYVPEGLSRDFASALIARLHGYRAVSVDDAPCLVPRTGSLTGEFRRKVRTMARGLETLRAYGTLLSPSRYGRFALMLWVHKLGRWLVSLALPLALPGIVLVAAAAGVSWTLLAVLVLAGGGLAALGVWLSERGEAPEILASWGYLILSAAAGVFAWGKALRGEKHATWEPTRR